MKNQILDTDYENYLIEVKCFDSMNFALEDENEAEPVHMLIVHLWTRKPEVDENLM